MTCTLCELKVPALLSVEIKWPVADIGDDYIYKSKHKKDICMECFLRLAGLSAICDVTKLSEEWR